MYDKKSLKAEEFINHEEILKTIEDKPDVIVAKNGRLIAVRQADHSLKLNESYRHRFVSDMLLLEEGVLPETYMSNQKYSPSFVEIKNVFVVPIIDNILDALDNESTSTLILFP